MIINFMSLRKKAVSGVFWVGLGSIFNQSLNLIIKIVLARLLFPEDFGLFAMAIILIALLNLFVGLGMGDALIQRKKDMEKALNAAFVVMLSSGIVLFVLSYFSSYGIAWFFENTELILLVKLLSVLFIVDSLALIPSTLFIKNLQFMRKTIIEFFGLVCYGVIVVFLAYKGFGVLSLVYGVLLQHCILTTLFWIFSSWKPSITFDSQTAKEILHFGKHVLGADLLGWGVVTADNAVLGKVKGNDALGFYSMSFNIATLPVTAFAHLINGVLYPVYAKLQDEIEKLRISYLLPLRFTLLFIIPIAGGLYVLADPFVSVVFGERWIPMTPILQILAIYGVLRTICTSSSSFLTAVGRPKTARNIAGLELVVLLVLVVPGTLLFGILGTASSVVIARSVALLFYIVTVSKSLLISPFRIIETFWKQIIAAFGMIISLHFLRETFFPSHSVLNLSVLVLCGAFFYGMFVLIIDRNIIKEIQQNISFSKK